MTTLHKKFITDEKGHKVSVVLDVKEYERLIQELEDLQDLVAYDQAKASNDELIPYEQVVKERKKIKK